MYICERCETPFDVPQIIIDGFWDDDRFVKTEESCCPICNWHTFFKADICPACREYKDKLNHLCRLCRKDLAKRFCDFADGLIAEEEAQIDDWMDGTSITERIKFS